MAPSGLALFHAAIVVSKVDTNNVVFTKDAFEDVMMVHWGSCWKRMLATRVVLMQSSDG